MDKPFTPMELTYTRRLTPLAAAQRAGVSSFEIAGVDLAALLTIKIKVSNKVTKAEKSGEY